MSDKLFANIEHSALIEQLADQFQSQVQEGAKPSVEDFLAQFPQLGDELRPVLETIQVVHRLKPEPESVSRSRVFPQIDDFEILREAGRGGMGVVYECRQISLSRQVALKVLPQQLMHNRQAVERFQREARSAAQLHHSNIVPIYEVGNCDDYHYYAMQFIEGDALNDVIEQLRAISLGNKPQAGEQLPTGDEPTMDATPRDCTPGVAGTATEDTSRSYQIASLFGSRPSFLPNETHRQTDLSTLGASQRETVSDQASENSTLLSSGGSKPFFRNVARLGRDVASALQYAHERGIVHRDIKPANLMLDCNSNVWITDFGLVKTEESDLTRDGDMVGTLRYMSPERFRGICDARGDVYALGVTLYEMLALQPPFSALERMCLIEQIKSDRPMPLRKINSKIPLDLQTIIDKAIEKEPNRRYTTAEELAEDLSCFLNGQPIRARRVGTVERLWLWSKKNVALAASLAILSLLLVTIATGSTLAAVYFRVQEKTQSQLAARNLMLAAEQTQARELADEQRLAAETAERAASQSRDEAKAIAGFLVDMLRSPDAIERGHDVTVVEVLDQAAESLSSNAFAKSNQTRGELATVLGLTYLRLGKLEKSAAIQEQAILWKLTSLDKGHRSVLESKDLLAQVYLELGKSQLALPSAQENLDLSREAFGPHDPLTIRLINTLGLNYLSAGRFDEAISMLEEGLRLDREFVDPVDSIQLTVLGNLVIAYQQQGNLPQAALLEEEALKLHQQKLGEEHPDTMRIYYQRSLRLIREGRFAEALPVVEKVLELRRKVYGPTHPVTLSAMERVATTQVNLGNIDVAAQLYAEYFDGMKATHGPLGSKTLIATNSLLYFARDTGHPELALPYLTDAFNQCEAERGGVSRDTTLLRLRLGVCLLLCGEPAQARDYLQVSRDRFWALDGPENLNTVLARKNLGECLLNLGEYEAAEHEFRDNILLAAKTHRSWPITDCRRLLGAALAAQQKLQEAEASLLEAHQELVELANLPTTIYWKLMMTDTRRQLFQLYMDQGRTTDAEPWHEAP